MPLSRPPRQWAKPDHNFGDNAATAWHDDQATTVREQDELAAAKIQHDIVIRAQMRMVPRGLRQDTLAQQTGISVSVIGKLFRGDRPLHLVHLTALERVLGPLRPGST